ncbi:uncharacterized protein J3D65DRAFT_117268 [Phyllosticta citribraziliensis]|uniref:Uncharacterized protein n=1 Tax=Phyllosticta citribraziliensis TaxID=989973 RepID=A0ABR1LA03_9PEZI
MPSPVPPLYVSPTTSLLHSLQQQLQKTYQLLRPKNPAPSHCSKWAFGATAYFSPTATLTFCPSSKEICKPGSTSPTKTLDVLRLPRSAATTHKLDDGRLDARLKKFRDDEKAGKSAGDYDFGIGGGFHVAIVILGAAAMGVGAKIRDDDRAYMMQALKTRCFGMYDKEKKDIYQALEKYENNGKSVKISAPGLIETCETLPRHPHRIPGMINLPDPGMFAGHETVPLTM